MDSSGIQGIIARLDEILQNKNNEPLDQLGSYIVGATLARDDIENHFSKFPELEEVAELGAELETLSGSEYANEVFQKIRITLDSLKQNLAVIHHIS